MYYDLTTVGGRKKFVRYANSLLEKKRTCVCLVDESGRTPNQNSYVHVLCRIVAMETGVTEVYAKQVYFKELANHEIFVTSTKDDIAKRMVKVVRSSCDLTVTEMTKAIKNFINWAADNGIVLPEANIDDDGTISFSSEEQQRAYEQAKIEASKNEQYL